MSLIDLVTCDPDVVTNNDGSTRPFGSHPFDYIPFYRMSTISPSRMSRIIQTHGDGTKPSPWPLARWPPEAMLKMADSFPYLIAITEDLGMFVKMLECYRAEVGFNGEPMHSHATYQKLEEWLTTEEICSNSSYDEVADD